LGLRNETKLLLSFISILALLGFTQVPIQDAEAASKVTICHNGDTKEFPEAAVAAHLAHGDTEGACPDDIVSTSQGSNGFGASNSNFQGSNSGGGGGGVIPPDGIMPVGGEMFPVDTTALLLAATYSTASWMIPLMIAAVGFGIIITRQKSKLKHNSCPSCNLDSDDIFILGDQTVGKCDNPKCRVNLFFIRRYRNSFD